MTTPTNMINSLGKTLDGIVNRTKNGWTVMGNLDLQSGSWPSRFKDSLDPFRNPDGALVTWR